LIHYYYYYYYYYQQLYWMKKLEIFRKIINGNFPEKYEMFWGKFSHITRWYGRHIVWLLFYQRVRFLAFQRQFHILLLKGCESVNNTNFGWNSYIWYLIEVNCFDCLYYESYKKKLVLFLTISLIFTIKQIT